MKLACITGASSGIGKEFAYLLADLEYDLILVGRNTAALHEIADNVAVRCKCITCDLSDEKSCVKLGKKLRKYPIDIMINNAGFGELGTFAETKLKNDINMINVNIKAVHILTKAVLPGFIQRDRGYIMNVASSAGLLPGGVAFRCAAHAALFRIRSASVRRYRNVYPGHCPECRIWCLVVPLPALSGALPCAGCRDVRGALRPASVVRCPDGRGVGAGDVGRAAGALARACAFYSAGDRRRLVSGSSYGTFWV